MATDSTELTFVRCPSCRSLVPAVSTRCRMCGATLEAGLTGGAETGGGAPANRVRQKTSMELSAEAEPAAPVTPPPAAAPAPAETHDDLEDFIKELESADADVRDEEKPTPAIDNGAGDDPLSEYIQELPVTEAAAKPAAPARGKRVAAPIAEEMPEEEEPAPKSAPIVRAGVSAKSSTGRSKPESIPAAPAKKTQRASAPAATQESDWVEEVEHSQDRREVRSEVRQAAPAPQARPVPTGSRRESPAGKNRLCGWLVSYAKPEGEALPLREGRFFVTASSLKPNDFIIEDGSVSTPHAMVALSPESGMQIQDLMSDRGVFVRRRGMGAYARTEERVVLEHGDWVRFGDVEYLVVQVPFSAE